MPPKRAAQPAPPQPVETDKGVDVKSFALGGVAALAVLLGAKILSGGKKRGASRSDDDMYVLDTPAKGTPALRTPAAAAATPARTPPPAIAKESPRQPSAAKTPAAATPVQKYSEAQQKKLSGIVSRLEGCADRLGAKAKHAQKARFNLTPAEEERAFQEVTGRLESVMGSLEAARARRH